MDDKLDGLKADMSPEAAAQYATGEAAGEAAEAAGHVAAEGFDVDGGGSWITDALRNTSPNPPLERVGDLRDIRTKWDRYGLRGLQKLGGVDDAEAWIDITKFALGAALYAIRGAPDESEASGESDESEDLGGSGGPLGDIDA